jgi:hypothetical protein
MLDPLPPGAEITEVEDGELSTDAVASTGTLNMGATDSGAVCLIAVDPV